MFRYLVFLLACVALLTGAQKPPNIVLILADDMGYETVTVNGADNYSTPELDKLAEGGMRFTHAYANPVCTPTRVKIMTGLYNARNYTGFGRLDRGEKTFAHLIGDQGYRTMVAGKWQLGSDVDSPQHFGFDEALLWQQTKPRTRLHPDTGAKVDSRYPNPVFDLNGVTKEYPDYPLGSYGPDLLVDHINDFITRHQDEPFFVYYPMLLPHWPFVPTPDSADWDPNCFGIRSQLGNTKYFPDMISYTSKMVGRIVDHLESLDLMKNTIVIFVGDNGTAKSITSSFQGEKVAGGKRRMDDRGVSVPFIAYGPGHIPAGTISDELVDLADIMPTLTDIAGVKAPAEYIEDGVSLWDTLRGQPGRDKPIAFVWYNENAKKGAEKILARTADRALRRDRINGDFSFYDASTRYHWNQLDISSLNAVDQQSYDDLAAFVERYDSIDTQAHRLDDPAGQ